MEIKFSSASSTSDNPLELAFRRRNSAILSSETLRPEGTATGGSDLSIMNSLELYQATGETSTSSLVEKGKMIATQINTGSNTKKTTFFPAFFHGTKLRQFVDYDSEAAQLHDAKVVTLIEGVREAHMNAATSTSPVAKNKKGSNKSNDSFSLYVRVATNGDFKVHTLALLFPFTF